MATRRASAAKNNTNVQLQLKSGGEQGTGVDAKGKPTVSVATERRNADGSVAGRDYKVVGTQTVEMGKGVENAAVTTGHEIAEYNSIAAQGPDEDRQEKDSDAARTVSKRTWRIPPTTFPRRKPRKPSRELSPRSRAQGAGGSGRERGSSLIRARPGSSVRTAPCSNSVSKSASARRISGPSVSANTSWART